MKSMLKKTTFFRGRYQKLYLLLTFLTLLSFKDLQAQKPTITSFSPASGKISTMKKSLGTNSSINKNHGIGEAIKATTIAASRDSLTLKAPSGNTYQNSKKSIETQPVTISAKIASSTPASSCSALASNNAEVCGNLSFPALLNNTIDVGTSTTDWDCLGSRPNQFCRAKSAWGLTYRVIAKITASTLSIFLNYCLELPLLEVKNFIF